MQVKDKNRNLDNIKKEALLQGVSDRLWDFINKNYKGKWSLFASDLGISTGSVQPWLNKKSLPGAKQLAKMAALGVDVCWLLTGEVPSSPDAGPDSSEVALLRKDLSAALDRIETLTNQLNESTRESITHARRALDLSREIERLKTESSAQGLHPEQMADVEYIHRALGLSGPVDVSQVLHAAATSFRAVTSQSPTTSPPSDDEPDSKLKREGGQGGKAVKRRRARSTG